MNLNKIKLEGKSNHMDLNKIKLEDILKLPHRSWDTPKIYKELLVVPSGQQHDSGFALMHIVGIEKNRKMEIAASCDDIFWNTTTANLRTDMIFPEGVIHFWSNYFNFQVGYSISSTNVSLIPV